MPADGGRLETARALAGILDDLERRTDALAELMLRRYVETIPGYRAMGDETLRQVREVNRMNLAGFIRALRGRRGPTTEELDFIRESASRRAREGIPLSALLAAYRTGAQLAWDELRGMIGDDHDRLRAGLDLATAVMRWVDEASGAAAQAYLAEYERLTSDREAARRDFLEGALTGALGTDEILARAEALALEPDVPHAVALVGLAEARAETTLRSALHRLRAMCTELPNADQSLVVARASEVVLVFPTTVGGEEAMATRLRSFVDIASHAVGAPLRGGVGRARDSLVELAGSYREASIALAAASETLRVALYGEVLVEELLLRERGVARRLARTILEPLDARPELRATLVEFVRHGPSLPAVARHLFLHPNTVAYRLGRVKELTGRDPKTPTGVADLVLALRAAELVGDEEPKP
jgi:DNA-binding PucR family transcriptional regulator